MLRGRRFLGWLSWFISRRRKTVWSMVGTTVLDVRERFGRFWRSSGLKWGGGHYYLYPACMVGGYLFMRCYDGILLFIPWISFLFVDLASLER